MRIHILTTYDFISYYFIYPLLVNRNQIGELNISIKIFDKITKDIFDCKILLIDSKYFKPLWKNREHALAVLQKLKEKSDCLVWLDTTDSSGSTHFQVLPYVDRYWKKQLLKTYSLYEKKYAGGRVYTDFYQQYFDQGVAVKSAVEPINREYLNKLRVSWNLGAGPVFTNHYFSNIMRQIPWFLKQKIPFKYCLKYVPPEKERKIDVGFRGSSNYTNKIISFQRTRVIEKLKALGVETQPVKRGTYQKELKKIKVGVSPFGFGEICFRDFEIFGNGALLCKPSMDHLCTFPDLFIEDRTYISFKWDFSDFEEKIEEMIKFPEKRVEISRYGQDLYKSFFSKDGQEKFCLRFKKLLCETSEKLDRRSNLP